MSRLKLHFALALSALLHGLLLVLPARDDTAPIRTPPRLQARLATPPQAARELAPAEPLLKDTTSERTDEARQAPPPVRAAARRGAVAQAREQAQQQLNRHVFYPPEAVERGLKGEVKVRLQLDPTGRVIDTAVLSGSGHAVLDQAALDAARQIGRIDAGGAGELLLLVVFRLE
ncbi:MAG: TonB family protein [Methyloversatilis sp.]|nr:TonB family protein [Methyloversatilis sp.]MBP6192799.1 TonB family protein [Methyloversatilis sp.]MBP9117696.1 TonB family protein [Methyloversatilis sp.]